MKKLLAVFITFLMCTGMFAAIALAEDAVPIKIAVWTSNEGQIALLTSFVEEFAQMKGIAIDVTFESIPFAEYNAKLLLESQGNAAADVFWVLETAAPSFIASGMLAELNAALTDYNPEDLAEGAMKLWQKDGKTYAVPFSTSPFFIIYNADMFAEAGVKSPADYIAEGNWTWESYRECAKQIKEKTDKWGVMTYDGAGYDSRILHNLVPIIRSYGGDAWDDEGNVLINQPEAVAAVQLFHDMLYTDQSVVPPGDESSFYSGDAAMTYAQISRISNLVDVDWAWDVAPMPSGPVGSSPVIGQAALAAFSGGKNVELATELVAYMTSESCVARIAGIWPPARMSVLESEGFLTSNAAITAEQMKMAVADSITVGRVLPSHLNYSAMEVEAIIVFDKLWKADANVQAVLDEVAQIYQSYMQ